MTRDYFNGCHKYSAEDNNISRKVVMATLNIFASGETATDIRCTKCYKQRHIRGPCQPPSPVEGEKSTLFKV